MNKYEDSKINRINWYKQYRNNSLIPNRTNQFFLYNKNNKFKNNYIIFFRVFYISI